MVGRKLEHGLILFQGLVGLAQFQITIGQRDLGFDRLRQGLRGRSEQGQGLVQITRFDGRAAGGQIGLGISPSDGITRNTRPSIGGSAVAGATIALTLNSKTYTTAADGNGAWSIAVPNADALPDGSYTPTLRMTTLIGQIVDSSGVSFTVDTVAPDREALVFEDINVAV